MTSTITPDTFDAGAQDARAYLTRELRLYDWRLPAGDHGSINIGWFRNGASKVFDPQAWLSEGYDGIRLIGAGVDKTVVRCDAWDGRTIAIGRHPGVVEFEGMTVYCGSTAGIVAGEQNHAKEIVPEFGLRLKNVKVIAPRPTTLGRTKWGVFYYQCDLTYENVEIDVREASEHGTYGHGFAKAGAYVNRLMQRASGAEGWKQRPDHTETAWLSRTPWIVIERSVFKNWYQPHSDRGGAAIVLQGAGSHVLLDQNVFLGGGQNGSIESQMRSKCVMVSSEGDAYDVETGVPGVGVANGYVKMSRCLAKGHSEYDWHNTIVRCGQNGGQDMQSAMGFWMERCGLYGKNMIVQMGGLPERRLIIEKCNTDAIREVAEARGVDTTWEATIPLSDRRIKVSDGLTR